jgi:hypothetical protein
MTTADPTETRERAAMEYLIWPLAAFDAFHPTPHATAWSRLHSRQAFAFGLLGTLAYLVLLSIPLLVVVAIPGIAITAVVWVYAAGLLADLIGAFVLLGLIMTYRGRALRGDLFHIPLVTPLIDRLFPLER